MVKGLFSTSSEWRRVLRVFLMTVAMVEAYIKESLGIVDYREMGCNCVDDSMPKF
jgi:hypothetical protein